MITEFEKQVTKDYLTTTNTMRDLAQHYDISKSAVNKYVQKCAKENAAWKADIKMVSEGKRRGAYSVEAQNAIRSVTCVYVK